MTDEKMQFQYWNHLQLEYKICAERLVHQLKNYAYWLLILMRAVKVISVSSFYGGGILWTFFLFLRLL